MQVVLDICGTCLMPWESERPG